VVTQRDRIWATTLRILKFHRKFTAVEVQNAIQGDPPSKRTIRNTLDSMVTTGFLGEEGGVGSAPRKYFPEEIDSSVDPGGYTPRKAASSTTIPYPGAKGSIANWIIDFMPVHDTYVEVFGGSAGVLFNKPRSKYEIYNDINADLTQFFSVTRDRPDELASWLRSVPYSRSVYEKWVGQFYDGERPDDPIERAGRYFALRHMQFAGVSSGENGFKTRARRSPARTFDNARDRIRSLAERFSQVIIENQHYREILEKYDDSTVDVLFYVDPPYTTGEDHYGEDFVHEELINSLQTVDNDWILSCIEVPDDLQGYPIRERESRHKMKRASAGVTEKLVFNFDPSGTKAFENP